jgi:hypothetical protein
MFTLPFEPYITNILKYHTVSPSTDPGNFFLGLLNEYGARVVDTNMFGVGEWDFETEEQRTLFMLKFGS